MAQQKINERTTYKQRGFFVQSVEPPVCLPLRRFVIFLWCRNTSSSSLSAAKSRWHGGSDLPSYVPHVQWWQWFALACSCWEVRIAPYAYV